jgi:hypothetical protein
MQNSRNILLAPSVRPETSRVVNVLNGDFDVSESGLTVVITLTAYNGSITLPRLRRMSDSFALTVRLITATNVLAIRPSGHDTIDNKDEPHYLYGYNQLNIIRGDDTWHVLHTAKANVFNVVSSCAPKTVDSCFSSIKTAVDYARVHMLDKLSVDSKLLVNVHPGTYEEDPIVLPSFVSIVGIGGNLTTIIKAKDPAGTVFTLANFSSIIDVTVKDAHAGGGILLAGVGNMLSRCLVRDCRRGYVCAGGHVKISNCGYLRLTGGVTPADDEVVFTAQGEGVGPMATRVDIEGLHIVAYGAVAKLGVGVCVTGTSEVNIGSLTCERAQRGLKLMDSATVEFVGSVVKQCDVGVEMDGAATCRMLSVDLNNSAGKDVDLLSQDVRLIGIGNVIARNKAAVTESTVMSFLNNEPGDEGLVVLGELHVGTVERPTESVFGEGDSYSAGVVASVDGGATFLASTVPAFALPGTAVGSWLYVASDRLTSDRIFARAYGLKVQVVQAAAPTDPAVESCMAVEYWNGTVWTAAPAMVTTASQPYASHGNLLMQAAGSFQVRLAADMASKWTACTLAGAAAAGAARFWLRVGPAVPLATAPTVAGLKLHSNRTEINCDGFLEFFGTARPVASLPYSAEMFDGSTSTPSNDNIFASTTFAVGRYNNEYKNNANDRMGIMSFLPPDIDTSSGIMMTITLVIPKDNATGGNAQFDISHAFTRDGAALSTVRSNLPTTLPGQLTQSHLLPVTAVGVQQSFRVFMDVSAGIALRERTTTGDALWVTVHRTNATADTHTGSVSVAQIAMHYVRWCHGAHITSFSRSLVSDSLANGWNHGGLTFVSGMELRIPPAVLATAPATRAVTYAFVVNAPQNIFNYFAVASAAGIPRVAMIHMPWYGMFSMDTSDAGPYDRVSTYPTDMSALTNRDLHVVFVRDAANGTARIFFDGVQVAQSTRQRRGIGLATAFAINPLSHHGEWVGTVKDVRVFDRALSALEVRWLHAPADGAVAADVAAVAAADAAAPQVAVDFAVALPAAVSADDYGVASGTATLVDAGAGVHVTGDNSIFVPLPAPVTVGPLTVVEFDYTSTSSSIYVGGVSLSAGADVNGWSSVVQVFGSTVGGERMEHRVYGAGTGTRRFSIPVGALGVYADGLVATHLGIICNAQVGGNAAGMTVSNVVVRSQAFTEPNDTDPALRVHYALGETTGRVVADSSVHAHHGAILGPMVDV